MGFLMYIPALRRKCSQCNQLTHSWANNCVHCNHPFQAPARIRSLGWVLLSFGILLSAGMVYLIVLIAGIIRHSNDPDAATRFAGDEFVAAMVFGVLGMVLMFGITSTVSGAWQIKHGTRNPKLARLMLVLGAIMILIGTIARALNRTQF